MQAPTFVLAFALLAPQTTHHSLQMMNILKGSWDSMRLSGIGGNDHGNCRVSSRCRRRRHRIMPMLLLLMLLRLQLRPWTREWMMLMVKKVIRLRLMVWMSMMLKNRGTMLMLLLHRWSLLLMLLLQVSSGGYRSCSHQLPCRCKTSREGE